MKKIHLLLPLLILPLLAEEEQGFETRLNAGLTLTQGNSESSLATISVESARKRSISEMTLALSHRYGTNTTRDSEGESNKSTTHDRTDGKVQYNYLYTPATYGLLNLTAMRDDVADVYYRFLAGPGLGHYLVKSEAWILSAEIGVAVLAEEVAGRSDNYPVVRAAQNAEHKLKNGARIWQNLEYLPKATALDSYLLNVEIGSEASLNGNLSLRLQLQNKYDSTPAPGQEYNDLALIAGLSMKW